MGWSSKLSAAVSTLGATASKNQDAINRGIDKAGKAANDRTGAKYDAHISKGAAHLRTGLAKLSESGRNDPPR